MAKGLYFRVCVDPLAPIIRDSGKNGKLRVLLALCSFASFKTGTTIVTNLGISRRYNIARQTVKDAIEWLEAQGLISITYKKRRIIKVHVMKMPLHSNKAKLPTKNIPPLPIAKGSDVKGGDNPLA